MAARLCEHAGLPTSGLTLLHRHATGVYLIPQVPAVLRVSPAEEEPRLRTALTVTRWLTSHDIAVTEPLDVDQPLNHAGWTGTFWTYYPQHGRPAPPAHYLGGLLRSLHAVDTPPMTLPRYQPLASLAHSVAASTHLCGEDRQWLLHRRHELLDAYARLDFPLSEGMIHGDAYPGNTLWDSTTVRLGDWDECAIGPRELDLANTIHGHRRFGRSAEEVHDFLTAYGHDPLPWPGLRILLDIRDIHTLGAYIRRADMGDADAAHQLTHRLAALRCGDTAASWLIR